MVVLVTGMKTMTQPMNLISVIPPFSTGLGLLVWLVLWSTSLLWSMQCCGDCLVPLLGHWYAHVSTLSSINVCIRILFCYYFQTAILGMVYITGIGCGLITRGITLELNNQQLLYLGDYRKSWKLLFAGGLVATLFWVGWYIASTWYTFMEQRRLLLPRTEFCKCEVRRSK